MAIKLETVDGYLFTPRYGSERAPTIWNPKDYDGRIPRSVVHAAWAEIADRFRLKRVHCDPGFHDETSFDSEIGEWDVIYGPDVFAEFPTTSGKRMFQAIRRFEADLPNVTHDGCPITVAHMRNARKLMARTGMQYTLGKPVHHQKIDAAVTSVLAHDAAAEMRAAGWGHQKPRRNRKMIVVR